MKNSDLTRFFEVNDTKDKAYQFARRDEDGNLTDVVSASEISSEGIPQGQVITSNGEGGAEWQPQSGSSITIDSNLDAYSTNPVENKVVTRALNQKVSRVYADTLNEWSDNTLSFYLGNDYYQSSFKDAIGVITFRQNDVNLANFDIKTGGYTFSNDGAYTYYWNGEWTQVEGSTIWEATLIRYVGIYSSASTLGQVLTSDGEGGTAWVDPSDGIDNTKINVGDRVRNLYFNPNLGYGAMNTMLASLTYEDIITVPNPQDPTQEIEIECCHNLLKANIVRNNTVTTDFETVYAIDIDKLGTAFGITGCTGYLIAVNPFITNMPIPVYVSAWNASNATLASAFGLPITNSGFYNKRFNLAEQLIKSKIVPTYENTSIITFKDDIAKLYNQNFIDLFISKDVVTFVDNLMIDGIQVGDKVRSLYINTSIGTSELNNALAAVVYDESETIPGAGITVTGLHTFLKVNLKWSNHTWLNYPVMIGADLSMMGTSLGISGCSGYFLEIHSDTGAVKPIYVSEWNSANEQLFNAMQIPVTRAGFYTDYIDIPYEAYGDVYLYSDTYPSYAVITEKDNVSSINYGTDFNAPVYKNFIDVFFSKNPSTFNGHFVTNTYQPTGVQYLTTAPTADNTSGLKFVVLSAEPATYYNGYYYIITEA